jgi:hypothetical protein
MEALKKVIYAGLFLILSNVACFSQNSAENDSLSFKRGPWSSQYYIGDRQVSYNVFIKKLGKKSRLSAKMFKTGRSNSFTGVAMGYVGSYCVGYYLGTRMRGAEGNTALLGGGGIMLIGGIILSYIGENEMKKALALYNRNSTSFSIGPAQTGIGLCINF